MQELKGKTALVTGVGRTEGIGMAICQKLLAEGVNVFYTYWHDYDMEQFPAANTPQEILEKLRTQSSARVECMECDLSQPNSPRELFTTARQRMGEIDILINNACYDRERPFSRLSADVLDAHYTVNIRAATLLSVEFVNAWNKQAGGQIINLTSGQSLDIMSVNQIPYTITKAGLEMLSKQLAPAIHERGIAIYAIDPGPTDTGWMDAELKATLRKEMFVNEPVDVANTIFSLLREDTDTATGSVIHVGRQ